MLYIYIYIYILCYVFNVVLYYTLYIINSNSIVNPSATITLTVGRTDDPITTITITPTLSQPVKLECRRTDAFKDWFTGDPRSRVTPTEGEISTKPGHDRTLLISSFQPIHATTYSCVMDLSSSISTLYPVVLGTLYCKYFDW